jgi:hypothetical protein
MALQIRAAVVVQQVMTIQLAAMAEQAVRAS